MSQCQKCFEPLYACCCNAPEIDAHETHKRPPSRLRRMTDEERAHFDREKAALAANVAKLKNG